MDDSSFGVDEAPKLKERTTSLRLRVGRSRAKGYTARDTLSSSSLIGKWRSHIPLVEDDEIEMA